MTKGTIERASFSYGKLTLEVNLTEKQGLEFQEALIAARLKGNLEQPEIELKAVPAKRAARAKVRE